MTKGDLITGKAYPVIDVMGSAVPAGMSVLMSPQNFIHVSEDRMEDWEVSDKAYGVILREIEDLKVGEVVVLGGWDRDGKVNIGGVGYYGRDYVEPLDRTNVRPGVGILDSADEHWKRIVAVDGSLWVKVDGGASGFRSPEEFMFPVSFDGDLMAEPLVTCLSGWRWVATSGKRYYLERTTGNGLYVITGDDGKKHQLSPTSFRMG